MRKKEKKPITIRDVYEEGFAFGIFITLSIGHLGYFWVDYLWWELVFYKSLGVFFGIVAYIMYKKSEKRYGDILKKIIKYGDRVCK